MAGVGWGSRLNSERQRVYRSPEVGAISGFNNGARGRPLREYRITRDEKK